MGLPAESSTRQERLTASPSDSGFSNVEFNIARLFLWGERIIDIREQVPLLPEGSVDTAPSSLD